MINKKAIVMMAFLLMQQWCICTAVYVA